MQSDTTPILIITASVLVAVMLAVAILLLVRRAGRRRAEALRSAAFSQGYDFLELVPDLLEGELGALSFFSRGRRGRCRNVWRRRDSGRETLLFDYRFTTGGGQHQSTVEQTVYAVRREGLRIPRFELRPEHVFHKVGAKLGYQDIDFDDSPVFSDRFLVRGELEPAVRDFLGVSARNLLERQPHWTVEGSGSWLIVTRAGKRVKPEDVDTFLRDSQELAASLLN